MGFMDFLHLVTFLIAVASVVCATTEKPSDNGFVGKWVYPCLEVVSLNVWKARQ